MGVDWTRELSEEDSLFGVMLVRLAPKIKTYARFLASKGMGNLVTWEDYFAEGRDRLYEYTKGRRASYPSVSLRFAKYAMKNFYRRLLRRQQNEKTIKQALRVTSKMYYSTE